MRYQISGKQIDIGEALQSHCKSEIEVVISKYPTRPTDALIVFSKDAYEYACETVLHLSSGITVQAKAKGTEIYAAFDAANAKMEKQLRRYKRRLKNHHQERSHPVELSGASSYILAGTNADGSDDTEEPDTLTPIIVAEMETHIPSLSVGEAVMQMELAGAPVLVFRNDSQANVVNVVYRRDDGNIGWIDPNVAT
ncbi:ribosome hibernation-promoting factor, HPF/YfiA family [Palleronia sp. LCG004]|uniref:ribosome hibernation-promoting factor, HPF/YfiA family n=1 Tax=Palleronia sp. LCG004 TaxID=3079304 RepID=UPI002941E57C|nr:ribosome-associated translation inhibitor RaiA [Palleronia sp. LCG004]WOI55995.1 ribosome-associated translation inhibitor RaiA [Palleronia sp. LCG004]